MADTAALREEGALLARVVEGAGDHLAGVGPFAGWTGLDTLAVLAFVDRMALLVVTDRAFSRLLEQVPSISVKVMQSLGERLHADAL